MNTRYLNRSYNQWMKSKLLSDEIKTQIKTKFDNGKSNNLSAQEILDDINSIEICICDVCGHHITFGEKKCPYRLNMCKLNSVDTTIMQFKLHKEYLLNNICVAAQTRDNTYLIERNKTEFMRKVSARTGKITGPKNIKIAHQKYDMKISCSECENYITCKYSDFLPINTLINNTCLTVINNSDSKKKEISDRNYKNWQNEDYAKAISNNLNIYKNFIEKDNIVYYFDRNSNKYVEWEQYKKQFDSEDHKFYQTDDIISYLNNLNYKPQYLDTFITENSKLNCGHAAFDKLLVDKNISWFVYIKFYNNIDSIKPLVVGKSGSYLVNKSGSDLSFSKSIKDGPARRFLKEYNYDWYYNKILLVSCDTENEAYNLEKDLSNNFKLFNS